MTQVILGPTTPDSSLIGVNLNYGANTSYYSYARPAQPGPTRTRLCIAAIAGD